MNVTVPLAASSTAFLSASEAGIGPRSCGRGVWVAQCWQTDERPPRRAPGSSTDAARTPPPPPKIPTRDGAAPDIDDPREPQTAAAVAAAVTQLLPVCVGHVVAVTDRK